MAAYPVDASTPSGLLERADAAMYHSKRSGRNAVSYFGVDGRLARVGSPSNAVPEEKGSCVPSTFSFT